jgi:hypothetical protein
MKQFDAHGRRMQSSQEPQRERLNSGKALSVAEQNAIPQNYCRAEAGSSGMTLSFGPISA